MLRPGDFTPSKKKPAATDIDATYDTAVTPKRTTNNVITSTSTGKEQENAPKELAEKSPTSSKPPYPMKSKPRGICVIFSNEIFDDRQDVNEEKLTEGGKIPIGQIKNKLGRTKNFPDQMKGDQDQLKNEPSQVKITQDQLKNESGPIKIDTSALPSLGNTRAFSCHPETPSPGFLDASYAMMDDANSCLENVAESQCEKGVAETPADNLSETVVEDTAYATNIDVKTFAIPLESDPECTSGNAGTCVSPDIKEQRQQLDISDYDRKGTEIDEAALCKTFKWLHFDVRQFPNRTADEIRGELDKIAQEDHSKYDAFVCCILSHGCEKGIYGKDWNCIPISEIRSIFKGNYCKSLREKPKIFFIQACRGKDRDMGTLKLDKATESEEPEPQSIASGASNTFPSNASEFDSDVNEAIVDASGEYVDPIDENGDATEHSTAEYDACPTSMFLFISTLDGYLKIGVGVPL